MKQPVEIKTVFDVSTKLLAHYERNVMSEYDGNSKENLILIITGLKRAMQIHAGDICSANNETEHFISINEDLEAENTRLQESLRLACMCATDPCYTCTVESEESCRDCSHKRAYRKTTALKEQP